jgi:hypothetical protein
LTRSRAAVARGALTVGFLGGSITAPKTGTRWPEPFQRWLVDRFPGLRLVIENAALGATGSDLGAFRAGAGFLAAGLNMSLGPLLGLSLDFLGNDYRFTFLWGGAIALTSVLFGVVMYLRWQRLGGQLRYVAPE